MWLGPDDGRAPRGWLSSSMPLHAPKAKPNYPARSSGRPHGYFPPLVVMSLLVSGDLGAFSAQPHSAGTFLIIV